MTDLKSYIEINHHLMTVKEMAQETGFSYRHIWELCRDMNLTTMSESDRLREYIKANTDKTIGEIAMAMGCDYNSVSRSARLLGIKLQRKYNKKVNTEKLKESAGPKLSFTSHLFPSKYDPINNLDYNYGD